MLFRSQRGGSFRNFIYLINGVSNYLLHFKEFLFIILKIEGHFTNHNDLMAFSVKKNEI